MYPTHLRLRASFTEPSLLCQGLYGGTASTVLLSWYWDGTVVALSWYCGGTTMVLWWHCGVTPGSCMAGGKYAMASHDQHTRLKQPTRFEDGFDTDSLASMPSYASSCPI